MAPGHPTSFRLSDEAKRMLAELETHLGVKKSAVLELAIRNLYRKETGRKKSPENEGKNAG